MICVIVPSIIAEILSVYYVIKVLLFNMDTFSLTVVNFLAKALLLLVPKMIAIHVAAETSKQAKSLRDEVGKYSLVCEDDKNFQKVRRQFLNFAEH